MSSLAPAFWFALGVAAGVTLMIARQRLAGPHRDAGPATIPPPLSPREFKSTIQKVQEGYLASMREYDRLIPWASAGALVLSMSFVGSFASVAPPSTKWILALAWILLTCALLSPIMAHYLSTRIKVWSESYVRARQEPPDAKKNKTAYAEWRTTTLQLDARKRLYQNWTRRLNILSAVFLITGLFTLGAFAVLAVPFGTESNAP